MCVCVCVCARVFACACRYDYSRMVAKIEYFLRVGVRVFVSVCAYACR